MEGPPSPVTAFSSCKVVPVQGSIPLPGQGLKAVPCLFPPSHECCAQLVEAERRDLDAKPCSSVPNPPPHPLKSLREQTGNGCADEISGVCCKPTRLRAPGSREALAACLALTGTGELPGIATPPFPLRGIPTEQGPAATGRVAAVLRGVNNTAPAWSTETTQQYLQLFYIWISTHTYLWLRYGTPRELSRLQAGFRDSPLHNKAKTSSYVLVPSTEGWRSKEELTSKCFLPPSNRMRFKTWFPEASQILQVNPNLVRKSWTCSCHLQVFFSDRHQKQLSV